MRSRSNLINFLLLGLFSFFSLNGQNNGIQVLEEVMNNAMNIENSYYKFNITSKNENDLLPLSGELYIKKEKYFIDTEEIDQIFDGDKLILNGAWDTRKYKDFFKKAEFVSEGLREIYAQYGKEIEAVYIEQSLQSFRSGFSSAKTLSTLSRFNGIVSWIIYEHFGITPE